MNYLIPEHTHPAAFTIAGFRDAAHVWATWNCALAALACKVPSGQHGYIALLASSTCSEQVARDCIAHLPELRRGRCAPFVHALLLRA